jgi:hypothetical protein
VGGINNEPEGKSEKQLRRDRWWLAGVVVNVEYYIYLYLSIREQQIQKRAAITTTI